MPAHPDPAGSLDLPPGVESVRVLSQSERGTVILAKRRGQSLVVRLAAAGEGAVAAEVALFARLRDPGLVPPTEWGVTPAGRAFLIRPYVEGLPLAEAWGAATAAQHLQWTRDLLRTLGALHDAGLVHRDVKSDNVLVGPQGLFLVDLDLVAEGAAAGGAGTPVHIAPEVLLGRPATPAADLFSLGVMLALAACGVPAAGFQRRFPQQSFWSAAGLDAERLDPDLRPLVSQLVRRHPADRPASARAAARLLPGASGLGAQLALPPLAGRETALQRLLDALRDEHGRGVLLVTVDDEEEEAPLLDHLLVRLALAGRRALRADRELLDGSADAMLRRLVGAGTDVVLARAADLPRGQDPVELVLAVLVPAIRGVPRLLLAMPPDLARAVGEALHRRPVEEEASEVLRLNWPRVPVAVLERHLAALSDGASPEQAARLARALHRRTSGRLADVNRLLERAERDGVLRRERGACTLLRDDWPDVAQADADGSVADVAALPAAERALLASLTCLDEPSATDVLAHVAGVPHAEAAALLVPLAARGAVQVSGERPRRWDVVDRRWSGAAWRALDEAGRAGCHGRAAEELQRRGAPAHVVARHRILAGAGAPALRAALDVAEAELLAGRAGAARELLQLVAAAPGADESELASRRVRLQARLELAQGHAADALGLLKRAHGEALADAGPDALLLAATACEQEGRREEARLLFRRVVDGKATREQRLRALTGFGYGLFLDGAWAAALEAIADEPRPDDPDEAAAGLLNLRGVALIRLQRHDEAQDALSAALARATAAGDALARARAELNLAHLDRRRGRPAAALEGLQRAVAAFTEAGHVQGRALALNNQGVLQRELGDLRRARALLEEALALRRRVGDAHGAAGSLGSLALVELEAGQVGAALASLQRTRELLVRGDYEVELALVDSAAALALALAGRHLAAAERLAGPSADVARREHPVLALRAAATVHLVSDQKDLALTAAREAAERAAQLGELGEEFRAHALLAALLPHDAAVAAALRDVAERLDSPVRRAEAALRTLAPENQAAAPLDEWLELFEAAGRTDLVIVTSRALAARAEGVGDAAARRRAAARAAQAADALTDGLEASERDATLQRVLRLAGGELAAPGGRRSLSLEWFLACNRRMAQEEDLQGLLLAIMDMALELTGARRGFLVLLEGDVPQVQVARGMETGDLPADEARFSRSVVLEAVGARAPVLTTDAAHDERFAGKASIGSLQLRSVLCVPLLLPAPHRGALYLDDDEREAVFDAADVGRLQSLADQAAVAITNLRRRAEIQGLNRRLAERVERQQEELDRARALLRQRGGVAPFAGLVGDSEAMQRVFALIERLAPTDLPVLVTGPSGSGKDLVARALHDKSRRVEGPLVIENVSALPASLLESELFGHVRGAFTGADRDRPGLFAEAHGGTFFLDEIGEMPMELQAKLLRVLESGEMRPVGARRPVKVDVRIVAATNRDLLARVREGHFREDLYYRLNAAEIRLPPLAQRLTDVPLLVQHFLERLNTKYDTRKVVTAGVVAALVRRAWPGQVRELSNEVARLYFLSDDTLADEGLVRQPAPGATLDEPGPEVAGAAEPLKLDDVERAAIVRALAAAGGRKDRAARLLGISRAGLYAKLKRFGLDGAETAD